MPKKTKDHDAAKLARMAESEKTRFASGMIVHDGIAHLRTLPKSLLITHTPRMALSKANEAQYHLHSASSEEERIHLQRVVSGLHTWVKGSLSVADAEIPLSEICRLIAERAAIGCLIVNDRNVTEYLSAVLAGSFRAQKAISPTFLLNANPKKVRIWATSEMERLVSEAAPGISAALVSADELWRLYREFLQNNPLEQTASEKAEHLERDKPRSEAGSASPLVPLWDLWGDQYSGMPNEPDEVIGGMPLSFLLGIWTSSGPS